MTPHKLNASKSQLTDIHVTRPMKRLLVLLLSYFVLTQFASAVDGLAKTVVAVKEHAAEAKLIWATTTPVREKTNLETFAERTNRVKVRNKLASEIMTEQQVPTDDLFELVKDHAEWTSGDGVHFNGQGNEALAKQVAESVLENLHSAELPKK